MGKNNYGICVLCQRLLFMWLHPIKPQMAAAYGEHQGTNFLNDILCKCSLPAIATLENSRLLCYWEGEDKYSDKLELIKAELGEIKWKPDNTLRL